MSVSLRIGRAALGRIIVIHIGLLEGHDDKQCSSQLSEQQSRGCQDVRTRCRQVKVGERIMFGSGARAAGGDSWSRRRRPSGKGTA